MRQGERNDHFPKDLELTRAQGLRDANIERRDLRYALIHYYHAGEEGGVEQDDELGDLVDTEIDDDERDQRDRRQRPEKIDHRIGEGARRPIPAQQESNGNSDEDSQSDTKEDPPGGRIDVVQQPFMQQKFDEFRGNLVR